MNYKSLKIPVICIPLALVIAVATNAGADTSINASAGVSYTNYEADANGKKIFSGNSLVQNYSLFWTTTNLVHRNQPRYYSLTLGYDWGGFNTKVTDKGLESSIKDSYGKFVYSGELGYAPSDLPIRFRAYANDKTTPRMRTDIYQDLLADGLAYDLEGRGIHAAKGFTFTFEPEMANAANLRGLPRLYLDYRETRNKVTDKSARTDNLTRELAMAGLNKENNWIQYKRTKYEDYYDSNNSYEEQMIRIGLIDNVGRRKWAPLTNWILVSPDGSLTSRKGVVGGSESEEYDINFHALATRRMWQGRTFMNYNRVMDSSRIADQVKVPLYFNGIWGADTDWNLRLNADRSREKRNGDTLITYSTNSISAGFTTFKRRDFILSPALTITTSKSISGIDSYSLSAGAETASTSRYSDKLFITAGYEWNTQDNGMQNADSKSWTQMLKFTGKYHPSSPLSYDLRQTLESGNGNRYINSSRGTLLGTYSGNHNYLRSVTSAVISYVPIAALSSSIDGSYDLVMVSSMPADQFFALNGKVSYTKNELISRFDLKYDRRDNGVDPVRSLFEANGELQYRPDRYNDSLARLRVIKDDTGGYSSTTSELLQRYTRTFFTKTGVVRNLATLGQEFSYKRLSSNGLNYDTKYLLLSGRYSPTSRLSLYGSVKYQSDPGVVAMFYNAGFQADFKLLATSLDYTLAKRDIDNRTERKIAANVRRVF